MTLRSSRKAAYCLQTMISSSPSTTSAFLRRSNSLLPRALYSSFAIHRSPYRNVYPLQFPSTRPHRLLSTMAVDSSAARSSLDPLPSSIAVIGAAGNMGTALISGIQSSPNDTHIIASSPGLHTMAHLPLSDVDKIEDNVAAVSKTEVVIIAVKPHIAPHVLREIAPTLAERTASPPVLLSVVAGLTTQTLSDLLGPACVHVPIVRCMPNTPAGVCAGVTAICGGELTDEHAMRTAEAVLQRVGIVERLTERQFDAATAIAGCGVAYLFMAAEALADAGVRYGLPRDAAQRMAAATVEGAGKLLRESGEHAAVLRNRVESPGGVTVAATARLEEDGFRSAIGGAVDAAVDRLIELEEEAEMEKQQS